MNNAKKSFLRANAWLFAAVFLLQGCIPDPAPDPFSFATQTKVAPGTRVESEPVTITGINVPVPVSIVGGEYSIDGHAYRSGAGTIKSDQKIRIRAVSSTESSGEVSATLTVGAGSATFLVKTVNFSGRVEAEAAALAGGASTVADATASKGKAVSLGPIGAGLSIADSLDARTLILAYRADEAGTLDATVNGIHAGRFTLRATAGGYATSSLIVTVKEGDVVAIANTSAAGPVAAHVDYVAFAESPFRAVSTLGATAPGTSDGISIGPNGDIYVSGGPTGQQIYRFTPDGAVSTFATGFSAHGSDFDSAGNLYVADYEASAVRKITPDGIVSTFASSLDGPAGIWVDQNDNVLVSLFGANFSQTGAAVLSITPSGAVSTLASGGGLRDVIGIVGDGQGRLFASNWEGGQLFDITNGDVKLLADTRGRTNMICYSHGYIYMPSPGDALVRRVSLAGTVETFIGTTTRQTIDGPLAIADFERPNSCAFSADETILYVMDRDTGLLRRVDAGAP